MKVRIYKDPNLLEDYAEIHCKKETLSVTKLADYIETGFKKILGRDRDTIRPLVLNEIFYFESVEKKTFAYLKESVWEVEMALRETEENYCNLGFVRISKSVVINIYKVAQLKSDFEMRMLLEMENKEVLIMNRHYRKNFQKCLEEMKVKSMGGSYEADT